MDRQPGRSPLQRFPRMCRSNLRRPKVADSTGAELTGAGLLTRTLILRRLLRRHVLEDDEKYVGVLLPPSVGAVVTNAALSLDHRIAVNLNYTAPADAVHEAINQCGIRHVLTSRRLIERLAFTPDSDLVYLEDFQRKSPGETSLLRPPQPGLSPVSCSNGGSRWPTSNPTTY